MSRRSKTLRGSWKGDKLEGWRFDYNTARPRNSIRRENADKVRRKLGDRASSNRKNGMNKIKKILLVGHENEGSLHLCEQIVDCFPNVEFMAIVGQGLYYRKSFGGSVLKMLREASWVFIFVRFLELVKFRLKGRTIYRFCRERGIKTYFTHDINSPESLATLSGFSPDLLVSLFTMQIYGAEVLKIPKYGAITSHPSILPRYRGLEVFFWVLANGEKETGVSIFFIEPKIDTGKVFEQEIVPITPETTVTSLYRQITEVGGRLLVKGIKDIDADSIAIIPTNGPESYYGMPDRDAYRRFRKLKRRFF